MISNMAKHGILGDSWCPFCFNRVESTFHVLWSCHDLKVVRKNFLKLKGVVFGDIMDFMDFMLVCRNLLQISEMELLCIVVWRNWFHRNALVHSDKAVTDMDVVVVSLINSCSSTLDEIGLIIDDISDLMLSSPQCKVCFISRKANMAAHFLAKIGLSLETDCFWMEEVPPSVVPIVLGETPT
ncbi:hypothetical protein Ddye_021073 [Dipteronia dyeriana]|uniref:RNase H type-1 domain-containing protein n=1 Tax=Dipteronia dyeriana TaxID=168575 RepID=A0AAD9U1R5_9ROSI|nr:hypothetical protein Ddye_021073 [Dipteronia dyeriana]